MEKCKPLGSLNSFFSYALQLSSVQSLSPVQTPWTAARQASLSITSSRGLLSGAKFCLPIVCILNSSLTLRHGRCGRWLLLGFPELSANSCAGSSVCWLSVWGALIHIWRPEITNGCDIFSLLIRQEMASLVTQTVKNLLACNAGDPGSIPASGRSPGEENGNPLQHSCLENSMDRGA